MNTEPSDIEKAERLADILKQHGRCWGNVQEYDMAYRAVMEAIARCAGRLGRDEVK